MYCEHFGLGRLPFKITPDTTLFFAGGQRGAALEALLYTIQRGEGITKVVGEVGTGKTMLCRMLSIKLPNSTEIVYLNNPRISADTLPFLISRELNLPVVSSMPRENVLNMLQNHLIAQHRNNKKTVILVEEAQSMPIETLEEIRLLTNLETEQNKLLQIILFGQPELDELLRNPGIRQFKDRISYNLYLQPFSVQEICHYLNFRMAIAGYKGPNLFGLYTARLIYQYSGGLLRRVNILADKVLLSAFSKGHCQIESRDIYHAAEDSDLKKRFSWTLILIAIGISSLLFTAGLVSSNEINIAFDNGSNMEDQSTSDIK